MSRINRRRFLQTSVAAAAAFSSVPQIAKAKDPNGKLGVAIVGVRGRGGDHIGGFLGDKRTVILYLVDPDEKVGLSRCEQVAKKQGIKPKFVRDMREAFQDPAVDLVGSATPNHWHALSAIWAMQAGKDVYVEKPVSHNVWEGRQAVNVSRRYNRIVQTGTQSRSSRAGVAQAIEWLRAGNLGEILVARGICYKRRESIGKVSGPQPIPPGIDYNLWCGPAPQDPLLRQRRLRPRRPRLRRLQNRLQRPRLPARSTIHRRDSRPRRARARLFIAAAARRSAPGSRAKNASPKPRSRKSSGRGPLPRKISSRRAACARQGSCARAWAAADWDPILKL